MARPIRPWFRFYVEAFHDPKIRRFTPAQRWVWVSVLGAARESPESGSLCIAPGVPMSRQELADYAGVKLREIGPALAAMEALSMVSIDANGLVSVTNWHSRQFESDDVTKRTREHRERSEEQVRNVPGNVPETETETETDKTRSKTPANDPRFEEFWAAYPRRIAKGAARKAWATAVKAHPAEGIIAAAEGFARKSAGADPKFIPHPASWLNSERWADETEGAPKVDDTGRAILPPLPGSFWDQR